LRAIIAQDLSAFFYRQHVQYADVISFSRRFAQRRAQAGMSAGFVVYSLLAFFFGADLPLFFSSVADERGSGFPCREGFDLTLPRALNASFKARNSA
jgi:hypothetical protein